MKRAFTSPSPVGGTTGLRVRVRLRQFLRAGEFEGDGLIDRRPALPNSSVLHEIAIAQPYLPLHRSAWMCGGAEAALRRRFYDIAEPITGGCGEMRDLGVFIALAMCGLTMSCSERVVIPAAMPKSAAAPPEKPSPARRHHSLEDGRQAVTVVSHARKRLAIRASEIATGARLERRSDVLPPLPKSPPLPPEPPNRRSPPQVAVLPPPPEPAQPEFPAEMLMPPSPEPAVPTFPAIPPERPPEAALPPPPEAAQLHFPAEALLPSPPEPAEPSLPSQNEIAAGNPDEIPYSDPPGRLSLHPRPIWVDTVGSIDFPHRPLRQAIEVDPERRIPRLVREPWPLAVGSVEAR